MMLTPKRIALSVAAVVVVGGTLTRLVVPWASAAGVNGGAAQVVTPIEDGNTPLSSGGSSTRFSLKLPMGAACKGDSANGNYRVQSYMVPASVDPSTLTFGSEGPIGGVGFRQPLYITDTSPYASKQTANADTPGGPGLIINIPAFSYAVYQPGPSIESIPPDTYNIGIACTLGPAGPDQVDKFFNVQKTFTADPADSPAQIKWVVGAGPPPTTVPPTTVPPTTVPPTTVPPTTVPPTTVPPTTVPPTTVPPTTVPPTTVPPTTVPPTTVPPTTVPPTTVPPTTVPPTTVPPTTVPPTTVPPTTVPPTTVPPTTVPPTTVPPPTSTTTPPPTTIPPNPEGGSKYTMVAQDGGVFAPGGEGFYGTARVRPGDGLLRDSQGRIIGASGVPLDSPVVAFSYTPSRQGYWLAQADGGVIPIGDAPDVGDLLDSTLESPIVGAAATEDGAGLYLVAADGGIFALGTAPFMGSLGGTPVVKPIVGMALDSDGSGYYLVASDGGVFGYDAQFRGSLGGTPLVKPIVGIAVGADGGYVLAASDGGAFTYGFGFAGSLGGLSLVAPIVGIAADPDGGGYWMAGADGGIFAFDAEFSGSVSSILLNAPISGIAAL